VEKMDNKIMDEFQEFQKRVVEKFEEHGGTASELFCAFMVAKEMEAEEQECDCGKCENCQDERAVDFDKLRGIVPDALLDAVLGKEKIETFIVVNKHPNGTDFFFQDAGVSTYKWVDNVKDATIMTKSSAEMVSKYVGGKVARKK